MTEVTPTSVSWRPATSPLRAEAVVASGPSAARLLRRVLERGMAGLSGVASADTVVLLGEAEALPWVEGVVYLGRQAAAPGVLFPTAWEPTVPVDLLAAALRRRVSSLDLPLAVVPREAGAFAVDRLVPLGSARPLDVETVGGWLRATAR